MLTRSPAHPQGGSRDHRDIAGSRRRSTTLEGLIAADAGQFRILTGDRPTGPLHLGHYFGTLQNRVRLQDAGAELFVLIADYQVLTDRDTAEHPEEAAIGLMLDYLAVGATPRRSVMFAHSAVPALNQLICRSSAWFPCRNCAGTRP